MRFTLSTDEFTQLLRQFGGFTQIDNSVSELREEFSDLRSRVGTAEAGMKQSIASVEGVEFSMRKDMEELKGSVNALNVRTTETLETLHGFMKHFFEKKKGKGA